MQAMFLSDIFQSTQSLRLRSGVREASCCAVRCLLHSPVLNAKKVPLSLSRGPSNESVFAGSGFRFLWTVWRLTHRLGLKVFSLFWPHGFIPGSIKNPINAEWPIKKSLDPFPDPLQFLLMRLLLSSNLYFRMLAVSELSAFG